MCFGPVTNNAASHRGVLRLTGWSIRPAGGASLEHQMRPSQQPPPPTAPWTRAISLHRHIPNRRSPIGGNCSSWRERWCSLTPCTPIINYKPSFDPLHLRAYKVSRNRRPAERLLALGELRSSACLKLDALEGLANGAFKDLVKAAELNMKSDSFYPPTLSFCSSALYFSSRFV